MLNVFSNIMLERIENITNNILLQDKDYMNMQDKLIWLYGEIKKYLPEDQKKLIDDYEKISLEQQALSEEIIYENGIRDGLKLKSVLKLVV